MIYESILVLKLGKQSKSAFYGEQITWPTPNQAHMHPYIQHEHVHGYDHARGHGHDGGVDHHSALHQTSSGYVQVQVLPQFVSQTSARRRQTGRYFQLSPQNYAPKNQQKGV